MTWLQFNFRHAILFIQLISTELINYKLTCIILESFMVVYGISKKMIKSKLINHKMKCNINNMNSLVCCSMDKQIVAHKWRQTKKTDEKWIKITWQLIV